MHPGRIIILHNLGGIFKKAFLKSSTAENAIHGFDRTGIAACDINLRSFRRPVEKLIMI